MVPSEGARRVIHDAKSSEIEILVAEDNEIGRHVVCIANPTAILIL